VLSRVVKRAETEPQALACSVENVTVQLTGRSDTTTVLKDLSLAIKQGETVAVVGRTGCGKSTLLRLICGLVKAQKGTVSASPAALMPQKDLLLPWLTALDNAALSLRAQGIDQATARAQVTELFQRFDLAGFEHSAPTELSGGMRQRVALIRTLSVDRPLLLLDEPFTALDAVTRSEMQQWLSKVIAKSGKSTLLVTHDVEEAALIADRIVVLTPRPATVNQEFTVTSLKPRRPSDSEVIKLRSEIVELLT